MEIHIKSIPQAQQRYPTVGDWWFDHDGSLQIRVSEEMRELSCEAVAIHELWEALLCKRRGISQASVDSFDKVFESARTSEMKPDEPGDRFDSPYFAEHQSAMVVEKLFIAEMDARAWDGHSDRVDAAFDLSASPLPQTGVFGEKAEGGGCASASYPLRT